MAINISEDEKARHPYYTIMDLRGDDLSNELSRWSRYDLIEWLSWNDRNGVYRDEDSLREFDQIISREEALEIMIRQITEA
ncbi:hypothetical protein [Flavobacterium sp. I-STPA6A]|uniref:hypothetical protein n=1 Tax=Flavobacterium sp. I-STPA6A TaxID=2590450 RepID=UPI00131C8D65|nr:hypothetical protein [Flavobacterium sp. I-STPA6A]